MNRNAINESDREADEYELALHRKSAGRGFAIGGALLALAAGAMLISGYVYVGMLVLPGALALANAWTHRGKAAELERRLHESRHANMR